MALMRTSVKFCRCPCSFLYCFLRLRWKTRILLPRPSPRTSAVTLATPGTVAKPAAAKVTAEVLGEGRGDKILVFHLKRKKQYKKLQGHRQNFTEVRIKAIEADGVTYTAAN